MELDTKKNSRFLPTIVVVTSLVLMTMLPAYITKSNEIVPIKEPCPRVYMTNTDNTSVENLLRQSIQTFGTIDKGQRYIVYDCSKAKEGVCGGWSDRMSGILSTLVISLLTKRRFLIKHDKPCLIEDYLIPADRFDWRFNKSILLNKTSSYQDLSARKSTNLRKYLSGSLDINTYFEHDVNFVRMNWDFTEEFRKRRNIEDEIPWVTKLKYADMYKQLFNFLFTPSPLFAKALNEVKSQRTRPKIACAHLRVGGNPTMPGDDRRKRLRVDLVWKHFKKLNKRIYDIFIATDAEHVKRMAKKRYPANIIDTPGKITHIDQPNRNDPGVGFLKQLLDFYTLMNCDVLITSESGFSIFAAYLRDTDSDLYCLRSEGIIPCTRYTINDIFPGHFLAPD
ncbi:uncharacterized protein LOC117343565 [Pecten maximus]|uniref:uncharacterized protein LOC117343565 n=1 Tax=Pecten maximus TaxID=6579 RepID=UPI0014587AD1|nr:uncharacterized protein LOC117343565 [Pecten maximus]XP_033761878.1 uncharacterized protein LOC117343565 [Pecten maximus]